jgi:hypothetical protein
MATALDWLHLNKIYHLNFAKLLYNAGAFLFTGLRALSRLTVFISTLHQLLFQYSRLAFEYEARLIQ